MLHYSSTSKWNVNRQLDIDPQEKDNNDNSNSNNAVCRRHSSFMDSPLMLNHTTPATPIVAVASTATAPTDAYNGGGGRIGVGFSDPPHGHSAHNEVEKNTNERCTSPLCGTAAATTVSASSPPYYPSHVPEKRASQGSGMNYTPRTSHSTRGHLPSKRGGDRVMATTSPTTGMPAPLLLAPTLKVSSVLAHRRSTGSGLGAAGEERSTSNNEIAEASASTSVNNSSTTLGPDDAVPVRGSTSGSLRHSARSSMCLPPLVQAPQQSQDGGPAPGGVSPRPRGSAGTSPRPSAELPPPRRSTDDHDVRLGVSEDGESDADTPRLSLQPALFCDHSSLPFGGGGGGGAAAAGNYCRIVPPVHHSIFFPQGFEGLPPVLLHYLSIGRWRTVPGGWDYYAHRRLRRKEAVGHTVRWLHNATPRDRFVFIVDPVEATKVATPPSEEEKKSDGGEAAEVSPLMQLQRWWDRKREAWLGTAPAFAYSKGKLFSKHATPPPGDELVQDVLDLHEESRRARGPASPGSVFLPSRSPVHALERERYFPNCSDGRRTPSRACSPVRRSSCVLPAVSPTTATEPHRPSFLRRLIGSKRAAPETRRGVEVIVVMHADITAADFGARLTTSRFSMEVREAHTYYFASLAEAMTYYGCPSAMPLVRQQIAEGCSHRIPGPSQQRPGDPPQDPLLRPAVSPYYAGLSASNNSSFASVRGSGHAALDFPSTGGATLADVLRQSQSEHQPRTPSAALHRTSSMQDFFYDQNNGQPHRHSPTNRAHHNGSPQEGESTPPPPLSAIVPVAVSRHTDTIISLHSEDPTFAAVLREVVLPENGTHPYTADLQTQQRLLALCEAGMPSWTTFVVTAGLPYRRVMRLFYVFFYHLWPAISLAVGLYDLYKHLPQLKRFLAHTLDPLNRWVEQHFTLRASVLVTYLFSVGLTTFTSMQTFFQQLSLVRVFGPLMRLLGRLLQLPFYVIFDAVWSVATIIYSFAALLLLTVKVLFVWPFMLVLQLAPLQTAGATAVQGTTLTVRWWRAWSEFWVTVASPVKNAAKAWYDGAMHLLDAALRRDASIRRWCGPQLARLLSCAEEVQAGLYINGRMWGEPLCMPAGALLLALSGALTVLFVLVWVDVRQPWGDQRQAPRRVVPLSEAVPAVGEAALLLLTFPLVERVLHPQADALWAQILLHSGACVGITKIELAPDMKADNSL